MNIQNTKTAYILHCVEDAKKLIKSKLDIKSLHIFTTHHSVNDYFNSKEIPAIHLSKFISDDLVNKSFLNIADDGIDKVLMRMDKLLSHKISSILNVNLKRYFIPLYVYESKSEYSGYRLFIHILDVLIKKKFSRIIFFDSVNFSSYTKSRFFLTYIEQYLQKSHCLFDVVTCSKQDKTIYYRSMIRRAIGNPRKIFPLIKGFISAKKRQKMHHSSVILLGKLYDLEFLKHDLKKNILLWPTKGIPCFNNFQQISNEQKIKIRNLIKSVSITDLTKENDQILEVLIHIFLNDFSNNILTYLTPILMAQFVMLNTQIDAVIWGNPPINSAKSLVNEFFFEKGVPVIGMQHGSAYGVQKRPLVSHFDSDYSRCTHFFSYGFNEKDLRLIYPERNAGCYIFPVGTTKNIQKNIQKKRKKVDVLFPITNCISFWKPVRRNPYLLAMYQEKIINKLEMLIDIQTVIKPMPGYTDKNFAFSERIRKLSHSKVSSLPLYIFLEIYSPKMIIIESISTPLYEILDEDVEILALNDFVVPFSPEALNLLKKRAHVFDEIEELLKGIDLWCEGKLPRLRDNRFYHKYIYRKNSKDVIISEIERIIEKSAVSNVLL